MRFFFMQIDEYKGEGKKLKRSGTFYALPIVSGRPVTYYSDKSIAVSNIFAGGDGVKFKRFSTADEVRDFLRINAEWVATDNLLVKANCRPVNPLVYHLMLTDYLGKQGKSFVSDLTSSKEVWNYPISGYEIKPFSLVDYSSISADSQKKERARGTKYLAEVHTTIFYSTEPRNYELKKSTKDLDDRMIRDSEIIYTLEFDYKKRLIGGEWGTIDSSAAGVSKAPDFLWGYNNENAKPYLRGRLNNGKVFDATALRKIYECSIDPSLDVEQDEEGFGIVDCNL